MWTISTCEEYDVLDKQMNTVIKKKNNSLINKAIFLQLMSFLTICYLLIDLKIHKKFRYFPCFVYSKQRVYIFTKKNILLMLHFFIIHTSNLINHQ